MTTARPRPLVLLLVVGVALVAITLTQALECSREQSVTKNSPAVFSLDQQGTRSIRFTAPMGNDKWDAVFAFGEEHGSSFTPRIRLELKKTKPTSYFLQMKLSGGSTTLLNHRVYSNWLNYGGQATLYISESTFNIAFQRINRTLLLQLTDSKIEGLDAVQVTGDLKVEECESPERVPETTTTTTSPPTTVPTTEATTTTTSTTTTPTTTTTTTTTPATTTPSPTTTTVATTSATTTEAFTTTQDDATISTTSQDESPYTCMPTEDTDTGPGVTTVCIPPASESRKRVDGSGECKVVPRWAWACAALAVVFFVFILLLIAYSITLYRRSWSSVKDLKNSGSRGFGMSAEDMYYYEMKNPNLMIGDTVPRIVTPRPSSTPGLTPSHSTSRLSHNYPSTPSPPPNTLPLPAPDLGDSMSDTTSLKEKSRTSMVSFADA